MYSPDLALELRDSIAKIEAAKAKMENLTAQENKASQSDKLSITMAKIEAEATLKQEQDKLFIKQKLYNADLTNPGSYWLKSPLSGTVLSSDFREQLTGANVGPQQPLLRIGVSDPDRPKVKEWGTRA